MALQYKVLERFSEEARQAIAQRVFDKRQREDTGSYVCEQGDCVFAALMHYDKREDVGHTPGPSRIARVMEVETYIDVYAAKRTPEYQEIRDIVDLNDDGKLATPEAVRALLLGE